MCSGGGGSSQPTSSTVYQQSLPPELAPYAKQLLGMTCAYMKSTPFKSYIGCAAAGGQGVQGTTVAGFSPMQQQAMTGMQQMGVAPQLDQATDLANAGAAQANQVASNYKPIDIQSPYQMQDFNQTALQNYQMQGPDSYTGQNVQQYMSPYMQNVVQQQQNQAIQSYANQLPQLGSAATQAGGLGGTREALMQAQAQQGLQGQLAGIQATGSQNAFQNAQQQFNAQNQLQQAANTQNLQANLGVQGQNLQQGLASNQYNLQNQQQNATDYLQAMGMNIGQQQFGSNLGMQAAGLQEQAAGQLGQLGQDQYGQQMGILQGQNQMGGQQQNLMQNVYNALNTNFQNAQNWTPAQLQFFSGMLHGTSPGALGSQSGTQSTYSQSPNILGQLAGTAAGVYGAYKGAGGKRGGKVKASNTGLAGLYGSIG